MKRVGTWRVQESCLIIDGFFYFLFFFSLIVRGKWSGFLNEWRKAKQSGGIQAARYGMLSFEFHRFQTEALVGKSGFCLLSIPSIAVTVEDKSIMLFQARRVAHPSSLNPRRAKAG